MLGKNYLVIQCNWNLSSGFVTQLVDHHHRIGSCRSFSCMYFSGISLLQNFKEINYVLPPWYFEASLAAGSPFGKKENAALAKSTSWLWSTPVQGKKQNLLGSVFTNILQSPEHSHSHVQRVALGPQCHRHRHRFHKLLNNSLC